MEPRKKSAKDEINKNEAFEAEQNLLGFFSLLLEVDLKNNPHLYRKLREKNK